MLFSLQVTNRALYRIHSPFQTGVELNAPAVYQRKTMFSVGDGTVSGVSSTPSSLFPTQLAILYLTISGVLCSWEMLWMVQLYNSQFVLI